MTGRVLGIDACKTGWVGVVLDGGAISACFGTTIMKVVAAAELVGEIAVVGIDIPIGLPDTSERLADVQARLAVGPRRNSVFMTPVRSALQCADHASAVRVNRQATGKGVSIQAFSLRKRILEVDTWLRPATHRVVEVHPEVSFAAMAGTPLLHGKTTWAGFETRVQLLTRSGITLAGNIGGDVGRLAGVDDVLDAAAAAWSARRVAAGDARSLPSPPDTFSDGVQCAIWA
ncbi:MAG: DUF429 domain-containing protein [Micromonosporaceae bacterium]